MNSTIDCAGEGSPGFSGNRHRGTAHAPEATQLFLTDLHLPTAWSNQPQWRILETGFGLGLNFLATWQAWRRDAARSHLLHFVATQAAPVCTDALLRCAQPFAHLRPLAGELAAQCWGLLPGVHRLRFDGGHVLLTLLIGDTPTMLRQHDMVADSIYLSDFDPNSTQMWSLHTFKAIARSCRRGTRLAACTMTAQGRKDLAQCGFQMAPAPELQPHSEPLHAVFDPHWQPRKAALWSLGAPTATTTKNAKTPQPTAPTPGHAIVIGAGLAGAACAQQLALRGWQVRVLDAAPHPAAGASALPAGIFAPHTSSDDSLLSRISRAGLRTTVQWMQALLREGQDWQMTGVLERRLGQIPEDEVAAHAAAPIAQARPSPLRPETCRTGNIQSENKTLRGQFLPDSPPHSPDMEQKGGENCAAAAHWQRTNSKPEKPLGAHAIPPSWHSSHLAPAAAAWSQAASHKQLQNQQLPNNDPALWHSHAGWLRPVALVQALLKHPHICFQGNAQVAHIQPLKAANAAWAVLDAAGNTLCTANLVVVCAGPHSAALAPQPLPLQALRGQVSWAQTDAAASAIGGATPVNGHGSWVPHCILNAVGSGAQTTPVTGWVMGSSFERDTSTLPPSAQTIAAAHQANWAKLQTLLPTASQAYAQRFATAHTWAHVRCASTDRLPVVGPLANPQLDPPACTGLWICTALGSRGLTWATLCAELLVARLHAEPLPVANALAKAISVDRYC